MASIPYGVEVPTAAAPGRSDALIFWPLCLYWLSQVCLVPVTTIGPWPAWPTFADFAIFALVPSALISRRHSVKVDWIIKGLLLTWGICLFSFAWATVIYGTKDRGFPFGLAQLTRLVQVIIAAVATAKLRLTSKRIRVLGRVSTWLFFFTALGVFITVILPPITFLSSIVLPGDSTAGPWQWYANGSLRGVGLVSYNHSYTGVQLILCAGLAISLNSVRVPMRLLIWFVLLASTFFTEARACFLAALVLVILYELKHSKAAIVGVAAASILLGAYLGTSDDFQDYLKRQQSSTSSLNEDGFNGRTDLWKEHVDYLAEHPATILSGVGFGYTFHAHSNNSHMNYLHVTTELGIFGLMAFLGFFWRLLQELKGIRAMYLTVIALLLTSLTQETFYPTLAFTHFLAFFMSAVVATIRIANSKTITVVL
jgi:O-antigen ligase